MSAFDRASKILNRINTVNYERYMVDPEHRKYIYYILIKPSSVLAMFNIYKLEYRRGRLDKELDHFLLKNGHTLICYVCDLAILQHIR